MKEINLILFLFFLVNHFLSQKITSSNLPKTLKEISGIEFINDSILVAHNDGGNSANLYLLNIHGKILDSVYVCNAKNTDWEDITKDNNGNLYIADIGNNNNRRKKLRILKISISSLLKNDSVEAKIYSFQYPDQELFPPPNNEFYYDAESICYHDNYLWIFTKCRTIPFDGKSKIYRISLTQIENAEWEKIGYIIPGRKSWKIDSFTSCTVYNNHFYLLTYTRLIIVDTNDISKTIKTKRFYRYIQREALAISPSGILCVANEGHWLLGKPKLKIYRNE
jgi:hypothetical protein